MQPSILIVVPTYGHFQYAARAVESALRWTTTLKPYVAVVDDASPERLDRLIHHPDHDHYGAFQIQMRYLREEYGEDRVTQHHFEENGGLTRSWNYGLAWAKERGHDFCCVTNSDVLFTPSWDDRIFQALNSDQCQLAGPVTNAPGTNDEQYVRRYAVIYDPRKKDDQGHIRDVASELWHHQARRIKVTTLNGFCLTAFTKTWWENAYDKTHVFRPRNDFNSKGEPNPTPLMTLNEYELQRRWHDRGLKSAACLGSYVYHYRAVSRGDKHKRGDWARIKGTA